MNHGLVAEDFDGEEDDGSDQHSDDYEDEYDEDLPDEGSRIGILGSGRHSNQPVTQYPPHCMYTNVCSLFIIQYNHKRQRLLNQFHVFCIWTPKLNQNSNLKLK